MFKDKHILVAMIVAPILAILAWYATDLMVSEIPIKPESGKSYQLAEKANCRWQSGECGLKNNDIELVITVRKLENDNLAVLKLHSNVAIDGVMISLANENFKTKPKKMQAKNNAKTQWRTLLNFDELIGNRIRVVTKYKDNVLFYGDVATTFIKP